MDVFDNAFNYVLFNECGPDKDSVVNHEKDTGGITKYGISLRFLQSIPLDRLKIYGIFAYEMVQSDDIIRLTIENAKAIYRGEFWGYAPFEKINVDNVRNYIFDTAVNCGIAPAVKCAQRACWAVHASSHILLDDGIMGSKTLMLVNRCGSDLLNAMRSERAGYYRIIVEKNPSQADFIDGWLNRAYGG